MSPQQIDILLNDKIFIELISIEFNLLLTLITTPNTSSIVKIYIVFYKI